MLGAESGQIRVLQELLQRLDAGYDDKCDVWIGWGDCRRYVLAATHAIAIIRWYDDYRKERDTRAANG